MDELERIKGLLPKILNYKSNDYMDTGVPDIELTPMSEENKDINSKIHWEKAFLDLIIEILDFDLSFVNAKTNFTNALLNNGSQYNPQQVYQLLDLITTRLERIHVVKRLCNFLGLQNEMDRIIECELELIYKTPKYNMPKTIDSTNPIAGEIRNA